MNKIILGKKRRSWLCYVLALIMCLALSYAGMASGHRAPPTGSPPAPGTYRWKGIFSAPSVIIANGETSTENRADTEEPTFSLVMNWLKLPNGWKFTAEPAGGVSGVAVDSQGRVYVAHRGIHPISYFDVEGNFLGTIGEKDIQPSVYYDLTVDPAEATGGTRRCVHSLHVDPWDNVWVTDYGRHIAMKFSPKGVLLLTLGTADYSGKDWNRFNQPTAVLVAPSGQIYVADGYGNSRIVVFSPDGKYLWSWGRRGVGPGEFNTPHDLAMDAAGNLYVSDRGNRRIQIFNPDGHYLGEWDALSMNAIVISQQGEVFASSGEGNHILRLDLKGHVLEAWDGPPGGNPHGLSLDREGNLYVADIANGMVFKYRRRRK